MGVEKQNYPKYKSHKVVEAFKIHNIISYDSGLSTLFSQNDEYYATIGGLFMETHKPQIGGYFVRYEDGYESFSPAEAFESGYFKLPENFVENHNPALYQKVKKAYFARAISQYGNKQDLRDIETIKAMGFEVVDPNQSIHQRGYESSGMAYFEALVKDCDVLIFRAFLDDKIGAGVGKEITKAAGLGMPVIELPNFISNTIVMVDRFLNVDATRFYLQMLGHR